MTNSFSVAELQRLGFQGFVSVGQLRQTRCSEVPTSAGVYVVVRDRETPPAWLSSSPGGRFKQRDPTVPVEVLKANWIPGALVVYIGKADQLQRRLRQYMDFGAGAPVGHWGGRLIWQIEDANSLTVGWLPTANPLAREAALIQAFVDEHGAMPFANLRR